jgi:hypothetical protein
MPSVLLWSRIIIIVLLQQIYGAAADNTQEWVDLTNIHSIFEKGLKDLTLVHNSTQQARQVSNLLEQLAKINFNTRSDNSFNLPQQQFQLGDLVKKYRIVNASVTKFSVTPGFEIKINRVDTPGGTNLSFAGEVRSNDFKATLDFQFDVLYDWLWKKDIAKTVRISCDLALRPFKFSSSANVFMEKKGFKQKVTLYMARKNFNKFVISEDLKIIKINQFNIEDFQVPEVISVKVLNAPILSNVFNTVEKRLKKSVRELLHSGHFWSSDVVPRLKDSWLWTVGKWLAWHLSLNQKCDDEICSICHDGYSWWNMKKVLPNCKHEFHRSVSISHCLIFLIYLFLHG